jgi:hypothetical protein
MTEKINRREFLYAAGGIGAAVAFAPVSTVIRRCARACQRAVSLSPIKRKLIVILFGGGTRSSETIDDPVHRYIPCLWNDMVPKGTLFTNMRVEHKVVHPNSAGSIMTGHREWDDIDWSRPVAHPTIFEIYRKVRHMPDTASWAFVYASILARTGESLSSDYGRQYAANVIEPPTIPRSTSDQMNHLMQRATSLGSISAEINAANECKKLARSTSRIAVEGLRSKEARCFLDKEYAAWKVGSGTTSHDVFLADRAIACMSTFAPDIIAIDFGEIDCAHYGSWSRYVEAIQRTDELTSKLWKAAEQVDEYRGRTLLLILPDHGRELDSLDHWGFIHHSNFYTNEGADEGCRRVWMLAIGQDVKAGRQIDKPVPITTVAATGLEYLGLEASAGAEKSVLELIT